MPVDTDDGCLAPLGADGGVACGLDMFGLPVTNAPPECVQAINSYYEAVLAYRPFSAWAVAEGAAAANPDCPLAGVLAADYAFCRGDAPRAKELVNGLRACKDAGASWSWREQAYLEVWTKWVIDGDPDGAHKQILEVVEKHPADLFAVKRGHIFGLILGDGARILAIVQHAAAAASAEAPPRFLHGMWSFGLEQQGNYEEAETRAREGLAHEAAHGADAWLDHALAHALYFQGEDRLDEAVEFLESRCASWSAAELHPFLYTHCWWHLALLHCESRDLEAAVKIFDERLWCADQAEMQSDPQVQLNALNLLWRLDTRGASSETRTRWARVLAGCQGVTLPAEGGDGAAAPCQHSDLLLDILILRGLCVGAAGDARALDAFLASIAAHGERLATGAGDGAAARAKAYVAIAEAVAALFRADQPEAGLPVRHSKARQQLRDLREQWGSLGGSEEQRGILLEAAEGPVICGGPERNYDKLFF